MGTNERSKITMTDDEVAAYVERSRTCTMATIGPTGQPHLVAMWYAVVDGQVWFETKAKSQKVQNLRRDDRITVSIEDGLTYDTLRGVALEGHATVVDDPDALWAVGRQRVGALHRPLHRGDAAVRRAHAQQAGRRPGRRRPGPFLGPPQAGDGADRAGRLHRRVPLT